MILYYTGTGNSRYVGKKIAGALGDAALDLFERIRSGDRAALDSDRPWVIVTPTYAWRIPHIVRDLLLETPLRGNRDIYFILTCGDGVGNAARYAAVIAARKDMRFMGLAPVIMPENYIAMFDAPESTEAKRIIEKADPVIGAYTEIIGKGQRLTPPIRNGIPEKVLSGIVNPVFYSAFLKDRKFTASDDCTGCGACEKRCPLHNIRIEKKKPVWQGHCTHCMACICFCPRQAIEYGKASIGKPRYKCPEL